MFEKVNPNHPDKVADRIAGALVDIAYSLQEEPKIAVEVLIGHGECTIISETSVHIPKKEVIKVVKRITCMKNIKVKYYEVKQDEHLAKNQENDIRCGDNGIFKGVHTTKEQQLLSEISRLLYNTFKTDGKYIINDKTIIICQSNATSDEIENLLKPYKFDKIVINPLGYWTGGINVDTGATNRKLGSDMGDAVTGGGLHGKDLSKADVAVNIYAHVKAKETGKNQKMFCAIGDKLVNDVSYDYIHFVAKEYINDIGGFEKLAEWGLI